VQFILVMTGKSLMKEEGYFARQGINVEFEKFPIVSSSLFPLINGDIAVSREAINPSLISANTKGSHVRIVADRGRDSAPNSCNTSGIMVRRFMVAYLEGVRQYNLGKTERNLEILSNYTPLDRDLLQRSCWVPIARNGDLPRQPLRDYMDWMYANKKITQIPDEDQIFDMSYVNYANGVLQNTTSSG
jgi:hypothetical protein